MLSDQELKVRKLEPPPLSPNTEEEPGCSILFAVVRWYPAIAVSCGRRGAKACCVRASAAAVLARACRSCGCRSRAALRRVVANVETFAAKADVEGGRPHDGEHA